MFRLMKLEWRKNRIKPYVLSGMAILLFCFLFCFLIIYIPQIEISQNIPTPTDMTMFMQWEGFMMLMSTLLFGSFAVLSAVMHARYTVEEYTGKHAILLFSYPVNRGKLLFAKCGFIFCFTVGFTFVGNLIVQSAFGLLSNTFSFLPTAFDLTAFQYLVKISLIYAVLSASVGLMALWVGFWRKSLVVTIVTAVLFISPFSNIASLFPTSSVTMLLIGVAILLLLGLLAFARVLSRVNRMEA